MGFNTTGHYPVPINDGAGGHGGLNPVLLESLYLPTIQEMLYSWGWDGETPTRADLLWLAKHGPRAGGSSFMLILRKEFNRLFPERYVYGYIPPQPLPAPAPWGEPTTGGPMPNPSFPVNHANSDTFPEMSVDPKESAYNLETAHRGLQLFIEKAKLTGDDKQKIEDAKAKLRTLYDRAKALSQQLLTLRAEAQAAADEIWHDTNQVRYNIGLPQIQAGKDYFNSEADRLAVEAVSAFSVAASHAGLQGEEWINSIGQKARDASYVNDMEGWSSQDPVARRIAQELGMTGGGGVSVGSGIFE